MFDTKSLYCFEKLVWNLFKNFCLITKNFIMCIKQKQKKLATRVFGREKIVWKQTNKFDLKLISLFANYFLYIAKKPYQHPSQITDYLIYVGVIQVSSLVQVHNIQ